jgi:hypothetical protein
MSRSLPATVTSEIAKDSLAVFWACDLMFDSPNELYFWSGIGDLVLDGNTYTGAGDLLNISELRESSDIAAYGATLTLSGIPTSVIDLAIAEPYQGRQAVVKFGVVTDDFLLTEGGMLLSQEGGGAIILEDNTTTHTSFTVFTGEMDQMNISFGSETVTISLEVESRLIDLERARIRRYTDADQKSRYPNDRAFEFVTRLQDEKLEWEAT